MRIQILVLFATTTVGGFWGRRQAGAIGRLSPGVLELTLEDSGFRVSGFGFSGFGVWVFGLRGLGLGVSGFGFGGFGVWVWGFRVRAFFGLRVCGRRA